MAIEIVDLIIRSLIIRWDNMNIIIQYVQYIQIYPLVICYIAIENGHRNSGCSHYIIAWWFSIVMGQFTRGYRWDKIMNIIEHHQLCWSTSSFDGGQGEMWWVVCGCIVKESHGDTVNRTINPGGQPWGWKLWTRGNATRLTLFDESTDLYRGCLWALMILYQ